MRVGVTLFMENTGDWERFEAQDTSRPSSLSDARVYQDEIYLADLNGSVISLVNFGDDLLTRHTKLTNQTDDGQWTANKAQIPRVEDGQFDPDRFLTFGKCFKVL